MSPTPRTIRSVVDFQRAVHTVAGSEQGPGAARAATRCASISTHRSALKPGILIVAMAGSHQLWVIDLLHDQAYPYAAPAKATRRRREPGDVRAAAGLA
jgi:hypothetical protein